VTHRSKGKLEERRSCRKEIFLCVIDLFDDRLRNLEDFLKIFYIHVIFVFRDLLFRNCCAEYELSVLGINNPA